MASYDSSAVLATIASLEKELTRLKGHLGLGDGKAPKPAKVKRERNPDAKPNPWIEFVKRLHAALKDVEYDGPATVVTLFGKAMKELYPDAYSLNEEALRAEFKTWLTPERLDHAKSLKRGSKKEPEKAEPESSASAAESSGEGEEKPKERKKRAPMTEEAKAAMAVKRAATKAAKAAGGAEPPATEPPAADAEPAAEPAAEKPKKGKKEVPTYTLEQLQDWEELTWEGAEYGRNVRGDVIDGEGNFAGHWDGTTLNKAAPKPADWDTIMA